MVPLRSSNVIATGYEPETLEMTVEFSGGGLYVYSGVPQTVYDQLLTSPSPGSFWQRHKGSYSYRRV